MTNVLVTIAKIPRVETGTQRSPTNPVRAYQQVVGAVENVWVDFHGDSPCFVAPRLLQRLHVADKHFQKIINQLI